MNKDFSGKIKYWNFILQGNYKKSFLLEKNFFSQISPKIINFSHENKKNYDKRVLLGALKYLPFMIFCFLKNLPMPWSLDKNIKGMIHQSQMLYIFFQKNLVMENFYLSRWTLEWIGLKIKKKKNFIRVAFPILDDEENFGFYEKIVKTIKKKPIFFRKKEFHKFLYKDWLKIEDRFENFFSKNLKGRLFFTDIPMRVSLLKIQFKGGLFFAGNLSFFFWQIQKHLKNQNFLRFWSQKNKSCLPFFSSEARPYGGKKFKGSGEIFLGSSSSTLQNWPRMVCFFEKRSYFFKFPLGNLEKRKSPFFFSTYSFSTLSKILSSKESLFSFLPFFSDVFLDQKKISVSIKVFQKENPFFKNYENCLSSFGIPILRRILLEPFDFSDFKTSLSYNFLLKKYCLRKNFVKERQAFSKGSLVKIFKQSKFFFLFETNWIEGGIQICKECHVMMTLLIGRKNLSFLNLDFNFNLKPNRTLSTKERKKSRFSNTFHLCREILRFTKMLLDCHVQMKTGYIDRYQLADGIHFIFSHMGQLTGLYRYKYKVMKQIRICKSIKVLMYQKLNKGKTFNDPGFTFWAPAWRVWVFFLRGMIPILERWLSNLLIRHFNGRRYSKKTTELSKQRVEAYFDIEIKTNLVNEIKNNFPYFSKKSNITQILNYANEAWKCWKANLNWEIPGLPEKITNIIFQSIKTKSDWWIKSTYLTREKIRRGLTIDKTLMRKNLGRLTRLWFKAEQKKQLSYLELGPWFNYEESNLILAQFSKWLELSRFKTIPFPSFRDKNDIKLLILALENVYQNIFLSNLKDQNRLKNLRMIEACFNSPEKTLSKIKEDLICQKIFKEIGISFLDNFSHLIPVFNFDFQERLTDSFLDQYLWYKANAHNLFPGWVKPSDFEVAPFLVFKNISTIGEILSKKVNQESEDRLCLKVKITNSLEKIEIPFLGKFLKKILDPTLAKFLSIKNNVRLFYKDITHLNVVGLIRGLPFSGFIIQNYFLLIDVVFLGLENSIFLCSSKFQEIKYDKKPESLQNVKFYLRYLSNIFIILNLKETKKKEKENPVFYKKSSFYQEMNIVPFFCNQKIQIQSKVPIFLGKLQIIDKFQKKSSWNPHQRHLFLEICGFKILFYSPFFPKKGNFWDLKYSKEFSAKDITVPQVGNSTIQKFENRIRQIILSSSSTTFTKIINRWNSTILGTVSFFREACIETEKFLQSSTQSEMRIQNRIKVSLNSKMPSRFPPVLFYSPKELGGLGMLSISNPIVPESDLKFSKKEKSGEKNTLLRESDKICFIPSLVKFLHTWKNEFSESQKIWTEYLKRRIKKKVNGKTLSIEDLDDLWDKGIPRINTLFQRDRNTLAFDHGWRLRLELKKYQRLKNNPFWWTSFKHDGKLWDLSEYRLKIIQSNGGIENILEHTLFKGTYFPSWEGLFWEKASGFEESFNTKKLTNAQRSGLNQIPNRRFTLWWSPTINRGNVYIGFQIQLDLTGIFMHGKIPTLKISLIQIFRAHLWQKIHESICLSFCKVLDTQMKFLSIQSIQKEQIHPRKSYKMTSSCADIVLFSKTRWEIAPPSLMSFHIENSFNSPREKTDKFWLDIQLRWGDFDSHDIERYSRGKFLDFTTDFVSLYPNPKGVLIAFDLAYNIFGGYGYWIPEIKTLFRETSFKIIKTNPALYILRERIRKSLQLYISQPNEPSLGFEGYKNIFKKKKIWIIDESCFYRVSLHRTLEGNLIAKPINGCLVIFLPDAGTLILRVIHFSFWKQQKRLSQLARWKVADEVSSLISTLPKEQLPLEILTSRKLLVDPLGVYLIDYPDITIKFTELHISFQSLLKLPQVGDLVKKTQVSQSFIFNLYDDWLNCISPFTAFSRIILILRALEIDPGKVGKIFGDLISRNLNHNTFWPSLPDERWVEVENFLKDLILEDFSKKKNCDLTDLTQNEIRDIILGNHLNGSFTNSNNQMENTEKNLKITFQVDKLKRTTFSSTFSSGPNKSFTSISQWKKKIFYSPRDLRLSFKIKTRILSKRTDSFFCVIPRNILKQFINISNQRSNFIAFIFEEKKMKNLNFRELKIFLIPPQTEVEKRIDFNKKTPDIEILKIFSLVGTIRIEKKFEKFPKKNDLKYSHGILEKNPFLIVKEFLILGLRYEKESWDLTGVCLIISPENFGFLKIFKIPLLISDRFVGFFLLPIEKGKDYLKSQSFWCKKKTVKFEMNFPFFA